MSSFEGFSYVRVGRVMGRGASAAVVISESRNVTLTWIDPILGYNFGHLRSRFGGLFSHPS